MKNCIEYKEQLSAYYDGELSESEASQIKEHLLVCDSCSALLEMYKEISIVTDQESVPVPDALRIGVMNRIQFEELYGPSSSKKPQSVATRGKTQLRTMLIRYMPIAACLVVVLLVWSFWGNFFNPQTDCAAPMILSGADLGDAVVDSDMPGETSAAPDSFNISHDLPAGGAPGSETILPSAEPAPDMAFKLGDQNALIDSQRRFLPESQKAVDELIDYLNGASYLIAITGELPEFLTGCVPTSYGPWYNWNVIYEVSEKEVQVILSQLQLHEDYFALKNNDTTHGNAYVVVLYSDYNEHQ